METHTETTVLDVLGQLDALCPEFSGAVVATGDGLVLAAIGDYQGDTPAACAASLFFHLQDDLLPLDTGKHKGGLKDLLVFGEDTLWYLTHLTADHLLLIGSKQTAHAGAVRLAGQTMTVRLNKWLTATNSSN